jgi:predicted ATPase
MGRFHVISGCSGGGKSMLVAELARRGYATFPEPGREIVREELAAGGTGLPWQDLGRFLILTLDRALAFRAAAEAQPGPVFFDRASLDALAAMRRAGIPVPQALAGRAARLAYAPRVFLAPPWPALFAPDAERRHTLAAAVAEYQDLERAWPAAGYAPILLPRVSTAARADLVEAAVGA